MNKLDEAVKEVLLRLDEEQDLETRESVLSVVGVKYAPEKVVGAPMNDLYLDDPEDY